MSESNRRRLFRIWRESDWPEVATFLGPNAERFRSAYDKTRARMAAERPGVVWSWCWPALVFGFAWFLYRKQWAIGAILLLLPMAIGYFFDLPSGGTAAVAVAVAAMAKSLVVQDAVARIAKIKDIGGGEAEIARAGGVSAAGGLIGGAILALGVAVLGWTLLEAGAAR